MDKWLTAFLCSIGICSVFGFEKLDPKYQIGYGNSHSNIKIVEYFSLSCPKCFEFFNEDFQSIRKKYVDTGVVSWGFHPDPADILTLQAMVCLERLPSEEKKLIFFETFLKHYQEKKCKHGCLIMQAVMEVLDHPVPKLADFEFLETTEAFREAFLFLKQTDVVTTIPLLEINGKIREEYPTKEFLEQEIAVLRRKKA